MQTGTARVRVTYLGRADLNGAPPPPETPPEIANALPAAPTGKVDTAALDIGAGRAVAPPAQDLLPCRCRRPSRRRCCAANQPTGQVTKVPVPAASRAFMSRWGPSPSSTTPRRLLNKLGGDLEDFHSSTQRTDAL